MAETQELLLKAQKSLKIQDIYLHSSSTSTLSEIVPFGIDAKSIEVQFKNSVTSHNVRFDSKKEENALVEYFSESRVRLRPIEKEKEEQEILVELSAKFCAIYTMENEPLDDEVLVAFGQHNVGFNVWPYCREYIASTTNRMRLPTITLPLYLPQVK